jgi:DMSO/TMAO reductase YedYZ molybdopterin-dependent catalytic subunit
LAAADQVEDVSRLGAKRPGRAVRLAAILALAEPTAAATHLGLHGTRDDFHASIPLSPVRDRGLVIYEAGDQPLAVAQGGPFRFFIPDHASCHVDEIDECANVKFLDRIELTQGKGVDNRPQDDEQHARLHQQPQ